MIPREQPIPIRDLVRQTLATFGQDEAEIPAEIPDDVVVRFAPTRPITVEVEEGELWLTLRILKLQRGSKLNIRRSSSARSIGPRSMGSPRNWCGPDI